jgi:c(7)-type cytochrome triheme protein
MAKGGGNMKFTGILAVILALMLSIGNAMAMPAGKIEYAGGDKGKVTYDAKAHADKGLKCPDCHTKPKLFEMKKGKDKLTMKDMGEGKFCGACHDGKKTFGVKAEADCVKCHKK